MLLQWSSLVCCALAGLPRAFSIASGFGAVPKRDGRLLGDPWETQMHIQIGLKVIPSKCLIWSNYLTPCQLTARCSHAFMNACRISLGNTPMLSSHINSANFSLATRDVEQQEAGSWQGEANNLLISIMASMVGSRPARVCFNNRHKCRKYKQSVVFNQAHAQKTHVYTHIYIYIYISVNIIWYNSLRVQTYEYIHSKQYNMYIIIYNYIHAHTPVTCCPLVWGWNPPKQGLVQSKARWAGHLGFRYIYMMHMAEHNCMTFL